MATPTLPQTLNVPINLDLGRIPTDIADPALYRELLRIHDAIERLAVGFTEIGDGGALEPTLSHGGLTGLNADDHPQYHNNSRGDARYVNLAGDTMTGDLDLAGNNLRSANLVEPFTAGENISAGELCYLDTNGRMSLTNFTSEALCSTLIAIALEPLTTSQSGDFLLHGVYTGISHGCGLGCVLYAGPASGNISASQPATSGYIVRVIGYSISLTSIYLNPDKTWIELK